MSSTPTARDLHRSQPGFQFADIAVTVTAKEFSGIYRNKKYHEPDILPMLDRALAAGVEKVMLTGMSLQDIDFNVRIADARPNQCYVTAGIHPYHAREPEEAGAEKYFGELESKIQGLLQRDPSPLVAFGELGLDYDRLNHASKETQISVFRTQLELYTSTSFSRQLPLFLHCRSAFSDFVDIITPYLPRLAHGGVVHSFVGSKSEMETLTSLGLGVSINGFSFQDEVSLEMVSALPLDKLQLETDAPWGEVPLSSDVAKRFLTNLDPAPPAKKRDKFESGLMVKGRNEPCMILRVAIVVAGLQDIPVEKVVEAAWNNSVNMFELGSSSIDKEEISRQS